jgi:hypothetical protein
MVIYMTINPSKTIVSFKGCGRKKVIEIFEWHKRNDSLIWNLGLLLVCEFTFNIRLSFLIIMQIWLFHSFGYSLNNITFIF